MASRPRVSFPISAIVGQETLKLALLLNAVDPRVGGVLIRGEKGTAKSTAVRALGAVMPPVSVSEGCPFGCDPDDAADLCDQCRAAALEGSLSSVETQPRIVELPVSATEDRVVGTLDFEAALKEGARAFHPGLLAAANRGILYVDEVNLLDDHLVDTLLDAAAMGVNMVEREGISVSHPARFILVGTMNPEEGELRPQLLDRFGLCVEVQAVRDPGSRVEIVRRRQAYEHDVTGFVERWRPAEDAVREAIARARSIVDTVEVSDEILYAIADLSIRARVDGHRADSVMARAAAANAALEGRVSVTLADIERVAELVLIHRLRRTPFDQVGSDAESLRSALRHALAPQQPVESDSVDEEPPVGPGAGQSTIFETMPTAGEPADYAAAAANLSAELDRSRRESNGRRQRTVSADGRGRYTRSEVPQGSAKTRDVAIDATIRAAAARRAGEEGAREGAVRVTPDDLRTKVRTRKTGTSVILCVDASGSMGASRRIDAAKAAAMELLAEAYVRRDRVALVSFRGDSADVVLPPTASVELARRKLGELPVGGSTPLAAGLQAALGVAAAEKRRDPTTVSWIVLITDGRANVGRTGTPGSDDALKAARQVASSGVHAIVIDTDTTGKSGAAIAIATAARCDYVRLPVINGSGIVASVAQRIEGA